MVTERVLWDIADALGMPMTYKDGRLTGRIKKNLILGWMRLDVPLRIVSAREVQDGYVVLARSLGYLGAFVARTRQPSERIEVGIIDLAQIDKPSELFERAQPGNLAEAYALVAEGEKRWFRRVGQNPWQELT
jgi:hypothetical protein